MTTLATAAIRLRAQALGFFSGVVYALLMAYLFTIGEKTSLAVLEFVSLAMILGTPLAVGVITVAFATAEQANSKLFRWYGPWVSVIGWCGLSLLFAWETLICVFMVLPAYLPLSSAGGVLGGLLRNRWQQASYKSSALCVLVLPVAFGAMENRIESPTAVHTVTRELVIEAPADVVWNALPNIVNIRSDELPWTLSHALGIPKPVSATTHDLVVGGVRDIRWEKGVHFEEIITAIDVNRRLAYDVLADEESMQVAELDTHVVVGDEYFAVKRGAYTLAPQGNSTRVELSTTYRITSKLNWFGALWANYVLDDFHFAVLTMLKHRVKGRQG